MHHIFYNLDVWKYNIVPFLGLKIFKRNYFRSVCNEFTKYINAVTSPYIMVPSENFPTIKSAYLAIVLYMDKLEHENTHISSSKYSNIKNRIPEIWLKEGDHYNTVYQFEHPIAIRGCDKNKTIINNGLIFKIKNLNKFNTYLTNLSITNNTSVNDYYKSGINYTGKPYIYIDNCKIFKCEGAGIRSSNGYLIISNSEIFNNNKAGIHIWGESTKFHLINLDVHTNKTGIMIGNIVENNILENIKCHHNRGAGISIGGFDGVGKSVIIGNKTDVSFNNFIDKTRYGYGIQTSYRGKIYIIGLDKSISHDNYNNQNYISKMSSYIKFKPNKKI